LIGANLIPIKADRSFSTAVAATNPILNQAGVIAYRILDGKVRVLLVTSRDTGRWIIPKGNIKAGEMPCKAAENEAYEGGGGQGDHYRFEPARDVHLLQKTGLRRSPCCNG
jgi:hypothetical protein